MNVGVHTPADVLDGALCASILIFALKKPMLQGGVATLKGIFILMIAVALGFFAYVHLWSFPADMDVHNLESGLKNAYTMLGCTVGMAIVYVADNKKLHFPVEATWLVQLIKVIVGLLLVLAVKKCLRAPLELLLPMYPARAVRYFLIVLTAGVLWPSTFRYFSELGVKK